MGVKVAKIKDKNKRDSTIKSEKFSIGIIKPTKIDFEKSWFGNNNKPTINPKIIDI